MIIIAGTVDVDPEQREAALSSGCVHMVETRKLPGCLDYVWSADPLTPGRIYVYERWQDQATLAAHFESPHFPAMRDTIAAHGIRGVDVAKVEVGRVEPVYDPQGRARADFFSETAESP
ncbi:MAG: antibiotic biosynthesis monooxygenase [bacterium]|nr:antibiotic biosynthesis monooxygenase [bacterium]MCP5071142.1 antibiotic biosynthesis monooxygenase [bacterium]